MTVVNNWLGEYTLDDQKYSEDQLWIHDWVSVDLLNEYNYIPMNDSSLK